MSPSAVAKRRSPDATNTNTNTNTKIVPIRIDVLSEDKTLRIVDTLLFDPACWPVTLYQPLYTSLEENITLMAHTILSDAEVQGMGRTVRHFTGRLDLWSPKLQKAVEDQLRPQLWKLATTTIASTTTTTASKHNNDDDDDDDEYDETLVPISIRLMIDRLVIHEDILWDNYGRVSPFEFARDMAVEMNLPDEATVAIATTITEQLHGLSIDTTPDSTTLANNIINNNNTSKSFRGAWTMDPKEHASIASQVVAQHRSI